MFELAVRLGGWLFARTEAKKSLNPGLALGVSRNTLSLRATTSAESSNRTDLLRVAARVLPFDGELCDWLQGSVESKNIVDDASPDGVVVADSSLVVAGATADEPAASDCAHATPLISMIAVASDTSVQ
jgi:hypothetical protein